MRTGRGAIFVISVLLLGSVLFVSGCADNLRETEDRAVRTGDTVQVDYVGRFENGTVFDTSIEETAEEEGIYYEERNYVPLTFMVGHGQVIEGFDEGIIGMREGEERNLTIPPEKAYGEYNETLILTVPLEELGLSEQPEVGQRFSSMYGQFKVIGVNETHVTLDFNHDLAGETLVFYVKLISIE